MFNEENFISQAKNCYQSFKKEITQEEINFAVEMAKEHNVKEEKMYVKPEADLTDKIKLRGYSWFNYIMVTTYKQFNLSKHV